MDSAFNIGIEATLNCSLKSPGFPRANQFQWLKPDGVLLATTDHSLYSFLPSTVSSTFLCRAKSEYGESPDSDVVTINVTGRL